MNNQEDIMSVCLAVVRGLLTPEQAREAILSRTTPEPLKEVLRLTPAISSDVAQLGRLPARERDECLDLFRDLYTQAPEDVVLAEDRALAQKLLEQRLISADQSRECLEIQKGLKEKGIRPLPRLGELLIKLGFLVPGLIPRTPASTAPPAPRKNDGGTSRDHPPLPASVQDALKNEENRFGRYLRISVIGRGGVGEVWKAWDLDLARWVALKFLKFEDASELTRLKREAQTAARLSHPGIATVFEIVESRDRSFLVLELIDGQTLESYPRNDHRKLVSLVREAALAIHFAHSKGIIHRDLKPANIMVDAFGRARVMDFGLARPIESNRSVSGSILGTPTYMSPEQARGAALDVRSDVYSLGATLYELLAGRPPFRGKNAFETLEKVITQDPEPLSHLGEDLRTIVLKCLMKEASRRYLTASEFAEDLRRWLEGEAILAHPPSFLYRLRKKAARWKAVLAVGFLGLAVAAGIAGWVIPRWIQADRAQSQMEQELSSEKAQRALDDRATSLARPHLDEGRKLAARLDRLLTTETWTPAQARNLMDQARKSIDRALALHPDDPQALFEKARLCTAENRRTEAIDYCTRAIEAAPGYATAYLQRARLLLDGYEEGTAASGRRVAPVNEEAKRLADRIRSDLRQVLAWSKDDLEIRFATAAIACVDGEGEKAARLLEDYAALAISDYRGWEWTSRAWIRLPDREEKAIQALTQAIRYRPRQASLHVDRGTAYLQEADGFRRRHERDRRANALGKAAEDFRTARDLEPTDPGASCGLGELHLEEGEAGLAVAQFTRALSANPKFPPAYVGRAWARCREGDLSGASSDADEALRLGSLDPRAWIVRAHVRSARDDGKGALADLGRALELDPSDAEAHVALGDARFRLGDDAGAFQEYAQALVLDPDLAESFHHRAIAQRSRGREDQAAQDLAKARALDPNDPALLFDLGVSAGNRQDWAEALAYFRKGLARMPSDPSPFWARVWVARAHLGERDPASEELSLLAEGSPGLDPEAWSARGIAMLLGKLSSKDYVDLAERAERSPAERTQAYYYAGERSAALGDLPAAVEFFKKGIALGAVSSADYSSAAAQLRALGRSR